MTDSPSIDPQQPGTTVEGGGGIAEDPTMVAVRAAAEKLQLLSEETRETVLARMDPSNAERIRDYLASMPDRPHGQFSAGLAQRRQLLHETANRIQSQRTIEAEREVAQVARAATLGASPTRAGIGGMADQPAPPNDPLDRLRELHPAAIARAMQGERAEAWAIVLERLDDNPRAALQLYLDASARAAILEARQRQEELAASSPELLATVEAAIARTVVPRAMREHHQLLSTSPMAWSGRPA